jgi:hypothetical protein
MKFVCRPGYSLGLELRAKELVWSVASSLPEVDLYRLDTPRNPLVIYDRSSSAKNITGRRPFKIGGGERLPLVQDLL